MRFNLPGSEGIKKRSCRYILQRYLGNYLEEKLSLDQLSVDLYNGTGTVSDVSLDCEALNELGDSLSLPVQIVDGYLKKITLTVPWTTLFRDDSIVEVDGLCLTVQPKVKAEPASSMLESMWSSMTSSSMQLAEECLREQEPPDSQPMEGIEKFAKAIDNILSKVKVKFINTKIRIEHVPKNGERGIALEIHIDHIDYCDEAGAEPSPEDTDPDKNKTFVEATSTNKRLRFHGVTLHTDEFPSKLRTMARSLIMERSTQSEKPEGQEDLNYQSVSSDIFYETKSVVSTLEPDPVKEILDDEKPPTLFHIEPSPDDKATQPEPILFGKLVGLQELSLKLKKSAELEGPKIELKLLLGTFIFYITPRQLHTLFELATALNEPHLEDTRAHNFAIGHSNIPARGPQCKPMGPADYQLCEAQLQTKMEQHRAIAAGGWSGPPFGNDDSDGESEIFHPMTSPGNQMAESYSSSVTSMSASMTSSVNMPGAPPRFRRNRKVPHIEGDPTAEVSHISLRIASISCLLIHKDVLTTTPQGVEHVNPASAGRLRALALQFFEALPGTAVADAARRDLYLVNQLLDKAVERNHLRLLTSEMTLDGSEKVTSHGSQTVCEASIKNLLLRECLYSPEESQLQQSVDLITFDTGTDEACASSSSTSATTANIKVSFKQTSKFVQVAGEKKLMYPTTDVTIKCAPFLIDVDVTLYDRLSDVLHGGPPAPAAAQTFPAPTNQTNCNLLCPSIVILLRFPKVDLRPGVDRDQRVVRDDYLSLDLTTATVTWHQAQSSQPLPTAISIKATTLDLYYHENDTVPSTHMARSSMSEMFEGDLLKGTSSHHMPTISLTFKSKKKSTNPLDTVNEDPTFEPANLDPMTTSMYIMSNLKIENPGPFSGKKSAFQKDAQHEGSPQGQEQDYILPGDKEEMAKFTSNSIELAAIHLDFNLPILSFQIDSKQLYEVIYNRINSDLLLWEPKIVDPYEINPLMSDTIYPNFSPFKGLSGHDSDSDSSSSESTNLYYSTYEARPRRARKPPPPRADTHNFCLTLKVGKGVVTIFAPVRDSNKRVVPGQLGELVVEAGSLSMCHVSGLNAQPRTAQLALRAAMAALYHDPVRADPFSAALIAGAAEKPTLRIYGNQLPASLKPTIYPSGPTVMVDNEPKQDMFTLALKVEPDQENSNLKSICTSLLISHASLRHRGDKGVSWLTQLLDVLDVADYPVPGYEPSTVVTQMHVQLRGCVVDYRPLFLPIRAVVTIPKLTVSNNLIAATNTYCLHVRAEDCALFLCYVHGAKANTAVPLNDSRQPNLARDYICVLDMKVFDLSLRMEDKATCGPDQLQLDISASNSSLGLYTCWDSAAALCRLLAYVAFDGDSQPLYDPSSRHTSICSDQTIDQLIGLDDKPVEEIREISPSEIKKVTDLLSEAIKESPNSTMDEDDLERSMDKGSAELYYFPDESNAKSGNAEGSPFEIDEFHLGRSGEDFPTNAHVVKDLGKPKSTPKPTPRRNRRKTQTSTGEGSTDDEFCIIDPNFATPVIRPKPEPRRPASDAARLTGPMPGTHEEYFKSPKERSDVLHAPKSFPPPVIRYTLGDLSLNWHMYGGSDFRPATEVSKKKVTIDSDKPSSPTKPTRSEYTASESSRALSAAYRAGVSWAAGSERVRPAPRRAPARDPRSRPVPRGGAHRDKSAYVIFGLHKVKFQYEAYASGGTHASRQTLAIKSIQVLDRLECSNINKMLSQYIIANEPTRKGHMLVIKAVHLRPLPSVTQECCLKISVMPLRLNVDQDTLNFVFNFFTKLVADESNDEDSKSLSGLSTDSSGSRQTTPTHRPPVMTIGNHLRDPPKTPQTDGDSLSLSEPTTRGSPLLEAYQAERMVSDNLIQLEEGCRRLGTPASAVGGAVPAPQPGVDLADDAPAYFRRVVFSPAVPIRLDYVGKRVDLSAGPIAGLLLGLAQLNCSEITLVELDYRLGLLGFEKLFQWMFREWLADFKRHQIHGLLTGLGPMHSVVQFLTGICDLVWLPMEQWRRDGRLAHGLRRGAASFGARTALAALDITTRILNLIQATAETALDMLTPGPTLALQDAYLRRERRRRRRHDPSRHPADLREGVASAYNTVREGFSDTATTITLAARSSRGVDVLRHLPGAAVAPIVLAAAGAADVLGGVRAHLAPAHRRDSADKWRPQRHDKDDKDT